ncbi:MAG: C4-dicarboxylate transport protein [Syntrophus sp. PtaU1.Bin005]|jgi:Na+/H+-dicarboxylate symporter|uniref:dicarboxylate/amino acid:cation symporter n=1 Tax=Syntrophus sp. (in: bacteria) TaxID=48412 RepID=UPI0009D4B361|nr:MAG: C4-dicarboxylate transport protein [Syntrophus sp. PtaB.Bin138]OPY81209.1 MAG: C4-dicarboxylate transport protein [Syntrophus sp. PtaU1.Bin005]
MKTKPFSSPFLRSYGFSLLLLFSIGIGSGLGLLLKEDAALLKPLGDIFLNLLFTALVPLVFFSISSAVAGMTNGRRLGRILFSMLGVFVLTGAVASVFMMIGVSLYPPAAGVSITLQSAGKLQSLDTADQIVRAFTTPDFPDVLSKKNMSALILFAILIGLATSCLKERGRAFADFLTSASDVMIKAIDLIMYYAPVGLCAYFAYLTGVFGPKLLGSYFRAMTLYYPITFFYFFAGFSIYAYLAGKGPGVRTFWRNIVPPALTALATGSSVAAIPSNLEAANRSGVPKDISELVIPIGATIHMDGSCLAAVLKIAFLFGIFNLDFSGTGTLLTALGIALLSGTVMSGIPGGGFIGELLIISLYGFPLEAFPIISMIGVLVDPPATLVNSAGDNVCSMMVARMLGGKRWMNTVDI